MPGSSMAPPNHSQETSSQPQVTRHYQHPPFCCENVETFSKINIDAAEHAQIDHFVGIMKHDPHGNFAHDSNWEPTICVNEITRALVTSQPYQYLISIQTDFKNSTPNASSASQPVVQLSGPPDKFFVSTWGTAHCNFGSYLEVDLKNGTWSSAEVIRQALSPYYNNERQVFQEFRCEVHRQVRHRVWVWEISTRVAKSLQVRSYLNNEAVFPIQYKWPTNCTQEEMEMAHRHGITVGLWRRWKAMNELGRARWKIGQEEDDEADNVPGYGRGSFGL
jgi:hypothetical protein